MSAGESCNSNCDSLEMNAHEDSWENVLGYRYNSLLEKLHIAPDECDPDASTKRWIL